ncbi:uncharacterized protein B0H64DRAFT_177114 [Chaetomium fimeti]|uniref:Uncharacterized protein n=1 Tax=Chaetomium fimeti TaxID=1854472 RepID=A0AAE0HCT1_9PEZI|nr:hypothetical protein B0H64DRAFT_177114 [Chaetomium fimeti]
MYLIVFGYYTRVSGLYSDHGLMALLLYPGIRLQWRRILRDQAPHLSPDQVLQVVLASSRARRLGSILKLTSQCGNGQRPVSSPYLALLQGGYLISGSFFISLNGVAFSLSYGITQLVSYRWVWAPRLEEDIKSMGFGQIMAVFLLILPFLAAAESYYGTDWLCIKEYLQSRTELPDAGSAEPRISESGILDGTASSPPRSMSSPTPISQTSGAERVKAEFVNNVDKIKKYLAGDVYYIRHIEAQQEPSSTAEQDLIEKKRAVLIRYERLIECERQVFPKTKAVAIFLLFFHFSGSITLGVLLNLVKGVDISSGLAIAMVLGAATFVRLKDTLTLPFQQPQLVSLEQPETRSQESGGSQGGDQGPDEGNALELDEIAAARRTATVLLEEGGPR